MANSFHLSFSIGPVQGFVAQARRTRDLWCGSWMLSWLAESALVAIEDEFKDQFDSGEAQAIIPHRGETRGQLTSIENATGGVPNRFEIAFATKDDAARAGGIAKEAFIQAWLKAAAGVWTLIENHVDQGNDTKAIWDRQVATFWELSWIVAESSPGQPTIGRAAAARKLFRNVAVTAELGIKCSLMPELQELSGHMLAPKQTRFWDSIRRAPNVQELDIRDKERLSAIALIKRLFPRVDDKVVGKSLQQKHWPSTAFLAALPWLQEVDQHTPAKKLATEFIAVSEATKVGTSEYYAARDSRLSWAALDGSAWFTDAIDNNEWGIDPAQQTDLKQKLRELYQALGKSCSSESRRPVPFYALLLMDGDSMGKLLESLGSATELSRCLGKFTNGVDEVVKRALGRTVYAGGDDVLALLPATKALKVANTLAGRYQKAFREALDNKVATATISAGIVYAHWKQPLRQILEQAHRLLDDVAKRNTGRDSLAIGIMKGSGLNAQWSAPWEKVRALEMIDDDQNSIIHRFCDTERNAESDTLNFNASFTYHLRDQFSRLLGEALDRPGSFGRLQIDQRDLPDGTNMLLALANAEYRRRLPNKARAERKPAETADLLRPLIEISQRMKRNEPVDPDQIGFDAWRVARFLKQVHDGEVQGRE